MMLLKATNAKLGPQFAAFLKDTHLPSLGCSAEFSARFAALLSEGDVRAMSSFMRDALLSQSK